MTQRLKPKFALLLEIEPCERVDYPDDIRSYRLPIQRFCEVHAISERLVFQNLLFEIVYQLSLTLILLGNNLTEQQRVVNYLTTG